MTETPGTYLKSEPAVTRTYSLTITHIAKVQELAHRLGVSQGEIVRSAIDLFWDSVQEGDTRA